MSELTAELAGVMCPDCGHMPVYHGWYSAKRCDGGGPCGCLRTAPEMLAAIVAEREADAEARVQRVVEAVEVLRLRCIREGLTVNPIELRDVMSAALQAAQAPQQRGEPCRQCGPGYRIGDDGCRHGSAQTLQAECCCEVSPPEFGGPIPDRECPIHGEAVQTPPQPLATGVQSEEPACSDHRPVQHRDAKPKWCNACGKGNDGIDWRNAPSPLGKGRR